MKNQKLDIHATSSERTGILGVLETFLRRFQTAAFSIFLAPILFLYIFCLGVSLTPGFMLFSWVDEATKGFVGPLRSFCLASSVGAGFFLYGFTLIFIVPLVNKLLPLKLRPQRSTWYSLSVVPWYYHNALTYLVRYTFLEFITPTPLNKLFFQMMGMKVGKGTMINSSNISDPALIEIGDYVTIGGSATLVAHYGMKGMLIIDRLIIKDRATIGLKASLFGDVIVGEGALVKPHEAVLPKTRIPDFIKKEDAA